VAPGLERVEREAGKGVGEQDRLVPSRQSRGEEKGGGVVTLKKKKKTGRKKKNALPKKRGGQFTVWGNTERKEAGAKLGTPSKAREGGTTAVAGQSKTKYQPNAKKKNKEGWRARNR